MTSQIQKALCVGNSHHGLGVIENDEICDTKARSFDI